MELNNEQRWAQVRFNRWVDSLEYKELSFEGEDLFSICYGWMCGRGLPTDDAVIVTNHPDTNWRME